MELIIAVVIVIVLLIALKVYTYKKARYYRELGYSIVYYYMNNCGDLQYYRNIDRHIEEKFHESYSELDANKRKWFLSFSSKSIINDMVIFYKSANLLTIGITPHFSLTHYFAHSECERFKQQAKMLEILMKVFLKPEFKKFVFKQTGEKNFYNVLTEDKYKHNLEALRKSHNKEFVKKELHENKLYFDSF